MKEFLKMLIIAIGLSVFIIIFVVQAFYIPSTSMRPLLESGDRILVNKFIYRFREPRRQEIAVFKYPIDPSINFVKRIIGVPNDEVKIEDGRVFLNGEALEEDYKLEAGYTNFSKTEIPKDHYFVLGDNRNNSEDSRYWGFVPEDNILGKAFIIFWPPSRMRLIEE